EELACRKGYIILMGVDLTRMTAIHLAEEKAGRCLFRRWANDSNGNIAEVTVGGCSKGFNKFNEILKDIESRAIVGKSIWRIYPSQLLLERVTEKILFDPYITHCGDSNCERCNDAVLGGPLI